MGGYINCIGQRFHNKGNPYTISKELGERNGTYWVEIIFDSGFVDIKTKYQALHEIGTKDKFKPSVHGVGCLGYGTRTEENVKIFDCWRAMIARCYNPKNPSYKTYGALGVVVCERWKRFDYFLEDIVKIEGYNKDLVYNGKLDLDKDFKSVSIKEYNLENCCWIPHRENVRESALRSWKQRKIKCND